MTPASLGSYSEDRRPEDGNRYGVVSVVSALKCVLYERIIIVVFLLRKRNLQIWLASKVQRRKRKRIREQKVEQEVAKGPRDCQRAQVQLLITDAIPEVRQHDHQVRRSIFLLTTTTTTQIKSFHLSDIGCSTRQL